MLVIDSVSLEWPVVIKLVAAGILLGGVSAAIVIAVFVKALPRLRKINAQLLAVPMIGIPPIIVIFLLSRISGVLVPGHDECWPGRRGVIVPDYCDAERLYWTITTWSWLPIWILVCLWCARREWRLNKKRDSV